MNSPITSPLNDSDRELTANALQASLVDLIDLSLIGKQARWNVVGRHFRDVHQQLDELVSAARQHADDVAERTNAIGVSPTGTAEAVAKDSGLPAYPEDCQSDEATVAAIVTTLAELIQRFRHRIDETGKSDVVTQDLLIGITSDLEEQHWMWQAQQRSS